MMREAKRIQEREHVLVEELQEVVVSLKHRFKGPQLGGMVE